MAADTKSPKVLTKLRSMGLVSAATTVAAISLSGCNIGSHSPKADVHKCWSKSTESILKEIVIPRYQVFIKRLLKENGDQPEQSGLQWSYTLSVRHPISANTDIGEVDCSGDQEVTIKSPTGQQVSLTVDSLHYDVFPGNNSSVAKIVSPFVSESEFDNKSRDILDVTSAGAPSAGKWSYQYNGGTGGI